MTTTTPAPPAPPGPPPLDPRLRARRIEVRRAEARKRLHRLVAVLVVVGVLMIGGSLFVSPVLDVDHIEVIGTDHLSVEDVVAASGVEFGQPMVAVDRGNVARLVEEVPWVRQAKVTRTWPGTVTIEVRERTAVASVVGIDDQQYLVDRAGRVLGSDAMSTTPVPTLYGVGTPSEAGTVLSGEAASGALTLAVTLPAATPSGMGVFAIERLDTGRLTGTLALPDGSLATVLFGADADLEAKVVAFSTVLGSVDPTGLAVVDVSVPSAPSLTFG